ncbi:hypothetical protein [Mesorhizobium sp. M0146]|uniref:hypothetical protein n=1 Tax=unclassified Mesorhizobium TaxID=325217 RepID=UPI003335E00E
MTGFSKEMQDALRQDAEKLTAMTGEDTVEFFDFEEPQAVQSPCPACFESSGYVWEHGNDWDSGPWSSQTNIPCHYCNGTGMVDGEPVTLDDLEAQDWEQNPAATPQQRTGQ